MYVQQILHGLAGFLVANERASIENTVYEKLKRKKVESDSHAKYASRESA